MNSLADVYIKIYIISYTHTFKKDAHFSEDTGGHTLKTLLYITIYTQSIIYALHVFIYTFNKNQQNKVIVGTFNFQN